MEKSFIPLYEKKLLRLFLFFCRILILLQSIFMSEREVFFSFFSCLWVSLKTFFANALTSKKNEMIKKNNLSITGTMTAPKIGTTATIRMMVAMKLEKVLSHCLMLVGRVLSQTSMSLANLLTMRPRGVVSKKDIGLRITRSRRVLCIR